MKIKPKIFLAVLVLIAGTAANVYLSAGLANILNSSNSSNPRASPGILTFAKSLDLIRNDKAAATFFGYIEILAVLGAVVILIGKSKSYEARVYRVTDKLSIPVPAGQGQHGTAWFMDSREFKTAFRSFEIRRSDEKTAELLKFGEKQKQAVVEYRRLNPERESADEDDDAPLDVIEFDEKSWAYEKEIRRRELEKQAQKDSRRLAKSGAVSEITNIVGDVREHLTRRKRRKIQAEKIRRESAKTASPPENPVLRRLDLTLYKLKGQRDIPRQTAAPAKSSAQAGVVIGREKISGGERIYCLAEDIHTLIIGATSCGKTRCLVLQTICALAMAGESIVCSDPKGELYSYTAPLLRKLGYKVNVVDFQEPDKSNCINPLQLVIDAVNDGDIDLAQTRAWDLVRFLVEKSDRAEPIWQNGEMSVLAAAVLCVVYDNQNNSEYQNLTNVYWFIAEMCKDIPKKDAKPNEPHTVKPIVEYVKSLPDTHPAKPLLGIANIAPDKTAGSFYTSALTTLRLYTGKGVYDVTRKSDFQFNTGGNRKEALFYIIPDQNETFYPIVTLLVSQQYEQLVKHAKKQGNRLANRVNFVLDEFGNFSKITGFETMLTVGRGYGIRFNLFLQGFDQLVLKYSKEVSSIIKGNCLAWVYLSSQDTDTLKEIEARLGEYTTTSYSLGSSYQKYSNSSSSDNVNLIARKLLTAQEISGFERPYSIVLSPKSPAVMTAPDLSKWLYNDILGLGNPKHNKAVIERTSKVRPDIAKSSSDPALWKIWEKWANPNGAEDGSENGAENGAGRRLNSFAAERFQQN